MRIVLTLILLSLSLCIISAFEVEDETLEQYISTIAEEETEEKSIELNNYIEELTERLKFGINLNTVTKNELLELGIISESAINDFISYRNTYGKFSTIYELKNIESFTEKELNFLKPFVFVEAEANENNHHTKIESSTFFARVIETKKGYTEASTNPYTGDPNRLVQKLTITRDKKLRLGLVAEKDPGEIYYHREWMPLDHCAGHIEVSDCKAFKKILLGDYRLNFGAGLIFGNSFIFKQQTYFAKAGISHYNGTAESNFFRGFATEIETKRIKLTPFVSYHTIDATVNPDSSFSSFYTSGLHRTNLERSKADNMTEFVSGCNLSVKINKFSIGTTYSFFKFSRNYIPQDKLYNFYKPTNTNHGNNISLNYNYTGKNASFMGEVAKSSNDNGFAIINRLFLTRKGFVDANITHRYYSPSYFSPYADAIRENTKVENENGFLTNINFNFSQKFSLNLYADLFSFDWLKYGVSSPSVGKEFSAQTIFMPNDKNEFSLRYRFKSKEKDFDSQLITTETNSLRFYYKTQPNNFVLSKTTINGNTYTQQYEKKSFGFHIQENFTLSTANKKYSLSLLYAYFSAKNYYNRIYCYESEIPGFFYSPMNYGVGHRFGALISLKINKNISLYAKYSRISYIDGRETISSSREEISGNNKNEIRTTIKLRW